MANRHLSRSVAMQSLFEWDFHGSSDSKIDSIISRNVEHFAPGLEDISFVKDLVKGVVKKKETIDKIIEKAAPEWPLSQIAAVDRNVLRIGLYELIFGKRSEVPYKVAINEAIELAKTFGGDSSGKFVNGVLGTVYREMGEPEDGSLDKENMKEEKLGGAVVYKNEAEDIKFALVHDIFGYWTLSKGKIEEGENSAEGAKREIKEEIGLDVRMGEEIGQNEYVASDPEKGKIKKTVTYFVAEAKDGEIKLKQTGGLDGARWFSLGELGDLNMYEDIRGIIAKAIKIIKKSKAKNG
ncbi:MAG: transcription antitermination factor NusB [Candidatus Pacebacteria bacterium]|nr:transcription antitermination factor NusB [Candidatus Paceibacterota bacterium]